MWFYWMKMWAPCKESVEQINPHRDSNEGGLVSCRREAVNSPGFWAKVISGDCSWTYWGAQIVSATGRAPPPSEVERHSLIPSCLSVLMWELWAPKCKLLRRAGLPAFFYLFIYSVYILFCQYLRCKCLSLLLTPLLSPRSGVTRRKTIYQVKWRKPWGAQL